MGYDNVMGYVSPEFTTPIVETITLPIPYCFDEDDYVAELKAYVDSTYSQHYAKGKIQATEMIIDMGDGLGFCRGNVMKYAKRYGEKAGYNRADLMKVLHYALMLLYVHDNYLSKE